MTAVKVPGARGAAAFVAAASLLLVLVYLVIGDVSFQSVRSYRAVVANTSGLSVGDDVRAAGVAVGRVTDVRLRSDARVVLTFTASHAVELTTSTEAKIRYKNLTGDMFLDLTSGTRDGTPLAADAELPLTRTKPALDLDDVFNGFRPLLQGLAPDQVNQLAGSIIDVFEGQAGSINELLSNIGSFTGALADQDKLIGDVIVNLNTVLGTLNDRRDKVSDLVANLRAVVTGLAADRSRIGGSLERLNDLALTGSSFLQALRPELRGAVQETHRIAAALSSDLGAIDSALTALPEALRRAGRVGSYGSFYNLYICGITINAAGPGQPPTQGPVFYDTSDRCKEEGAAE